MTQERPELTQVTGEVNQNIDQINVASDLNVNSEPPKALLFTEPIPKKGTGRPRKDKIPASSLTRSANPIKRTKLVNLTSRKKL